MTPSLTHGLLMLGTTVVGPLALGALDVDRRAVKAAQVLGALAAVALVLPQGPLAASLAAPWALLAAGAAAAGIPSTCRALRSAGVHRTPLHGTPAHPATGHSTGRVRPLEHVVRALAPLAARSFWVVGAAWLLLDRLDADPVGVGGDLVLLTAVHFHFAGLAATAIVGSSARARLGAAALAGTLAAPVLVAAGFVALPLLQVVGAVVFTLALMAWSLQAGRANATPAPAAPGAGAVAGAAWLVARASVWVSMPLATWWATGYVVGFPAPSIPVMAATHGVANAVGFSLCGLLALVARPGVLPPPSTTGRLSHPARHASEM